MFTTGGIISGKEQDLEASSVWGVAFSITFARNKDALSGRPEGVSRRGVCQGLSESPLVR